MLESGLPVLAEHNPEDWAHAAQYVAQLDDPELDSAEKNLLFKRLIDGDDSLWPEGVKNTRELSLWAIGRGLNADFERDKRLELFGLDQLQTAIRRDKANAGQSYRGTDLYTLALTSKKLQKTNTEAAVTWGRNILDDCSAHTDMLELAEGMAGLLTCEELDDGFNGIIVTAISTEFNSSDKRKSEKPRLHAIPGVTEALTGMLGHKKPDVAAGAADLLAANDWSDENTQAQFLLTVNEIAGEKKDAKLPADWQSDFTKNVKTVMGGVNFMQADLDHISVDNGEKFGTTVFALKA